MPNLIDFTPSFANDAPNQVIGDVDLLRLQLPRGIVGTAGGLVGVVVSGDVGRTAYGRSWGTIGGSIRGIGGGGHSFLAFNEDVADIVGSNMNGIGNTSDAQDSL